jgi:aldehyde:ferredoxin oxidoreductase
MKTTSAVSATSCARCPIRCSSSFVTHNKTTMETREPVSGRHDERAGLLASRRVRRR